MEAPGRVAFAAVKGAPDELDRILPPSAPETTSRSSMNGASRGVGWFG